MTSEPDGRWSAALLDETGRAFGEILADDVELDGSVVIQPIHGKHAVWTTLRAAADVYEHMEVFTEVVSGDRVYLEWTATALGMRMEGVIVIMLDSNGDIAKLMVHHRPLAAVFAFSSEMARRQASGPGADHFYRA
ncbi:nuclear transport factor 2 family protein [Streptomyces sp. NPDC059629]|uniref:nuclear transport factor 2 family protein n=1 Tax=Streptomyces sp. NPDC059629 TaxID=3346889 RepID=UPI003675F7C0